MLSNSLIELDRAHLIHRVPRTGPRGCRHHGAEIAQGNDGRNQLVDGFSGLWCQCRIGSREHRPSASKQMRELPYPTDRQASPDKSRIILTHTNDDVRAPNEAARGQKLDQARLRQYQAGDMAGYRATRSATGDMARSLERDPQMESILANRKRGLGIAFESGRRLGQELAFTHVIDLGRGRGIGI
jgi:hypothetical protein